MNAPSTFWIIDWLIFRPCWPTQLLHVVSFGPGRARRYFRSLLRLSLGYGLGTPADSKDPRCRRANAVCRMPGQSQPADSQPPVCQFHQKSVPREIKFNGHFGGLGVGPDGVLLWGASGIRARHPNRNITKHTEFRPFQPELGTRTKTTGAFFLSGR